MLVRRPELEHLYTGTGCRLPRSTEPDLKAVLLATGFILCGCVRPLNPEDALTAVPYDLQDSGRVLVGVRINDRGPFPFALDTAASISFVFDELRSELALETVPEASATVHGVVASGQFPLVRVDRLQVGSEIWAAAEIVSLPGETDVASGIAGILGVDFLRRYGVGFFTQDRAVRLYLPEVVSDQSYRGWASVPLEPINIGASSEPLYFFEVEIGGRSVPALFDLGAGLNLINPSGAQFLRLAPTGVEEDAVLSDVFGSVPVLATLGSEDVTTAGISWRNEAFLIADLAVFSTLMHEDSPLAIIGAGLFNQRDFVIDFLGNRLLVRVAMDEVEPDSVP
jgi:hypothetical protein